MASRRLSWLIGEWLIGEWLIAGLNTHYSPLTTYFNRDGLLSRTGRTLVSAVLMQEEVPVMYLQRRNYYAYDLLTTRLDYVV